jgi:hypothetical protein
LGKLWSTTELTALLKSDSRNRLKTIAAPKTTITAANAARIRDETEFPIEHSMYLGGRLVLVFVPYCGCSFPSAGR